LSQSGQDHRKNAIEAEEGHDHHKKVPDVAAQGSMNQAHYSQQGQHDAHDTGLKFEIQPCSCVGSMEGIRARGILDVGQPLEAGRLSADGASTVPSQPMADAAFVEEVMVIVATSHRSPQPVQLFVSQTSQADRAIFNILDDLPACLLLQDSPAMTLNPPPLRWVHSSKIIGVELLIVVVAAPAADPLAMIFVTAAWQQQRKGFCDTSPRVVHNDGTPHQSRLGEIHRTRLEMSVGGPQELHNEHFSQW